MRTAGRSLYNRPRSGRPRPRAVRSQPPRPRGKPTACHPALSKVKTLFWAAFRIQWSTRTGAAIASTIRTRLGQDARVDPSRELGLAGDVGHLGHLDRRRRLGRGRRSSPLLIPHWIPPDPVRRGADAALLRDEGMVCSRTPVYRRSRPPTSKPLVAGKAGHRLGEVGLSRSKTSSPRHRPGSPDPATNEAAHESPLGADLLDPLDHGRGRRRGSGQRTGARVHLRRPSPGRGRRSPPGGHQPWIRVT